MNELPPSDQPSSDRDAPNDDSPDTNLQVVIVIVRTGGIAGIRRQWHVEPPLEEAPRWVALVEQCPWEAPNQEHMGTEHMSADRYIWSIRAHTPADQRERDVPDQELAGPWRALVDAAREATSAS